MKRNIVLNIPHASINGVFDPKYGGWPCNQYFVNNCLNRWTDWYTDFLFLPLSEQKDVSTVVFPYSRFVCDAERLEDDPLEEIGQGIIYKEYGYHKRNDMNEKQIKETLRLWEQHQKSLKKHIKSPNTVLIDCHSFPSDLSDCNICIGHNDDWSYNGKIVNGIVKIFKSRGYTVEINKPFSNSITPQMPFPYTSVMIEVNKRVYMNESTHCLEYSALKWMRWSGTLRRIYEFLMQDQQQRIY
jgi:N-formylglutamate amidohydrolase